MVTVSEELKTLSSFRITVPSAIVSPPMKVLPGVMVRKPFPALVRPPGPLMLPEIEADVLLIIARVPLFGPRVIG
jgi:hypothetical protein